MAYYHVISGGAGDKDGSDWDNAWGWAELSSGSSSLLPGDAIFFRGNITALDTAPFYNYDASSTSVIKMIGVKAATTNTGASITTSDWATGAERPVISMGNYVFYPGDYYFVFNLDITSSVTSQTCYGYSYTCLRNCKFTNTGNGDALSIYSGAKVFNCECISANASGIKTNGYRSFVDYCYIHDSVTGLEITKDCYCRFTIIESCTTGVDFTGAYYQSMLANVTINGCVTGMDIGTDYSLTIINNIISNCSGWGFKANNSGTVIESNLFDYNNWYNNSSGDMSWDNGSTEDNSAKGIHDTANDPKFVNAASGNFSLDTGSDCIGAGQSIEVGIS